MSRSNKARHGTRTKKWKDSVGKSRSQARSRAKWKKVKKNTKRPAHGSMRGKRQPKQKSKVGFGILTSTGIYDPKTKTVEPYDDDDDPAKPIEYEDPTGLYPPMRLAVMTGRPPTDFKETTRKPELTMDDVKHNMILDLKTP